MKLEAPKFCVGQLVKDKITGRAAVVREVCVCYAYRLDGDPSDRYLQTDEIQAIRKVKKPRRKK